MDNSTSLYEVYSQAFIDWLPLVMCTLCLIFGTLVILNLKLKLSSLQKELSNVRKTHSNIDKRDLTIPQTPTEKHLPLPMERKQRGVVRKYNRHLGLGFITRETDGMDMFVYWTDIKKDYRTQRIDLSKGDVVTFDVVPGEEMPQAVNVVSEVTNKRHRPPFAPLCSCNGIIPKILGMCTPKK